MLDPDAVSTNDQRQLLDYDQFKRDHEAVPADFVSWQYKPTNLTWVAEDIVSIPSQTLDPEGCTFNLAVGNFIRLDSVFLQFDVQFNKADDLSWTYDPINGFGNLVVLSEGISINSYNLTNAEQTASHLQQMFCALNNNGSDHMENVGFFNNVDKYKAHITRIKNLKTVRYCRPVNHDLFRKFFSLPNENFTIQYRIQWRKNQVLIGNGTAPPPTEERYTIKRARMIFNVKRLSADKAADIATSYRVSPGLISFLRYSHQLSSVIEIPAQSFQSQDLILSAQSRVPRAIYIIPLWDTLVTSTVTDGYTNWGLFRLQRDPDPTNTLALIEARVQQSESGGSPNEDIIGFPSMAFMRLKTLFHDSPAIADSLTHFGISGVANGPCGVMAFHVGQNYDMSMTNRSIFANLTVTLRFQNTTKLGVGVSTLIITEFDDVLQFDGAGQVTSSLQSDRTGIMTAGAAVSQSLV